MKSLFSWCIDQNDDTLLRQWSSEKNGEKTPQNVSYGSGYIAWWRCEKGHEWKARVNGRTSVKTGCPACNNKIVVIGENDLATLHPKLAAQWHPSLNDGILPSSFAEHSSKQVWWQCEKGHEWKAAISARVIGHACPFCTNRKVLVGFNDLATTHPEVAAQWHPTKNGDLTAEKITAGSHRKIWFICSKGHVWETRLFVRTAQKFGCPYCSGKKKSM